MPIGAGTATGLLRGGRTRAAGEPRTPRRRESPAAQDARPVRYQTNQRAHARGAAVADHRCCWHRCQRHGRSWRYCWRIHLALGMCAPTATTRRVEGAPPGVTANACLPVVWTPWARVGQRERAMGGESRKEGGRSGENTAPAARRRDGGTGKGPVHTKAHAMSSPVFPFPFFLLPWSLRVSSKPLPVRDSNGPPAKAPQPQSRADQLGRGGQAPRSGGTPGWDRRWALPWLAAARLSAACLPNGATQSRPATPPAHLVAACMC